MSIGLEKSVYQSCSDLIITSVLSVMVFLEKFHEAVCLGHTFEIIWNYRYHYMRSVILLTLKKIDFIVKNNGHNHTIWKYICCTVEYQRRNKYIQVFLILIINDNSHIIIELQKGGQSAPVNHRRGVNKSPCHEGKI